MSKNPSQALETQKTASTVATSAYQTASQTVAPKPLDQNKVLEQIASKMPHLKEDPTKFREELVQLASPKKAATRTSQAASQNTAPKSETPSPSPKTDPSSTKPLDSTISQGMTGTRV